MAEAMNNTTSKDAEAARSELVFELSALLADMSGTAMLLKAMTDNVDRWTEGGAAADELRIGLGWLADRLGDDFRAALRRTESLSDAITTVVR